MRKLLIASLCLAFTSLISAFDPLEIDIESFIPSTYVQSTAQSQFSVRISSVAQARTCLTDIAYVHSSTLSIVNANQVRLAILDGVLSGGTTVYEVSFATSTLHLQDFPFPSAICSSPGESLTINSSTGPFRLTYQGFYRKRP